MIDPTIAAVLSGAARYAVVCGDNREILPTLPDRCCDHVISDPPFEAEAHTLQRRVKRGPHSTGVDDRQALAQPLSFEPLSFETRTFAGQEIARLAKRWGIVFCQVEAVIPWRSALSGMVYKRACVWVKPDAMPQYSGDRPGMGYETIVCCHAKGRSRWNGGGRTGVFEHNKNSGGKHEHETQKPLSLMLELVSLFTDPGDIILDPFCGSGTTLVAALRLGRRCIGIEREPKWAALSRERCEAELAGSTLQAQRAGQLPMFGKGAA